MQAQPLTRDAAILESSALLIATLASQIRTLLPSLANYDKEIGLLFVAHPERALFDNLPGAGEALAPRLLVAFGSDRNRLQRPEDLQQLSGVAPVTRQSGKTRFVHRRLARPKFLLQTFHEFAGCSMKSSGWARAYYDHQRAQHKGRHTAVRALAFKWIRVLFRCWQDRAPYDESRYLEVLRKRGSPFLPQTA
jgi:transposase